MSSTGPSAGNPPIKAPPPGVTPNYVNPEMITYKTFITAGVCIALVLVFAGFRFYATLSGISKKTKWWKEVNFGVAVVLTLAYLSICVIDHAYKGIYGLHIWDILLLNFAVKTPLVVSVLIEISYPIILFWVKLCLLLLYLDLFGRLKWLRYCCWAGIVVIGCFHFAATVTWGVMCTPRTGTTWLDYLEAFATPQCERAGKLNIGQGVFNLISDIYLLIIPLPAIWALNMPAKRKLGISVMFLTGICANLSSILGLYFRVLLTQGWADVSWWTVPLLDTSMGELTAGLMVICMPAVAAVTRQWKTPLWVSSTSSYISSALRPTSSGTSWREKIYSSGKTTGSTHSTDDSLTSTSLRQDQLDNSARPNQCCKHGVNRPECRTLSSRANDARPETYPGRDACYENKGWTSPVQRMPSKPSAALIKKQTTFTIVREDV